MTEYVVFKKREEVEDVIVIPIKDSRLVEHARKELSRINNDFEFNESIINSIAAFAAYGHSGGSASVAIPMIHDLLQFKNITPLTNDPKEWNNVGPDVWQNNRCSEAFSIDGGKTHYLLSDGETRTTEESVKS